MMKAPCRKAPPFRVESFTFCPVNRSPRAHCQGKKSVNSRARQIMNMKFTQYFLHMRQRSDRAKIKIDWIEETIRNPDYTEVQSDGRIRKWKKIREESKFLRVILLP